MEPLHSIQINTAHGLKTIAVYHGDLLQMDQPIDILTTSAYFRSYVPTPGTVFEALYKVGVSVEALAGSPELDLRNPCNVWISREVQSPSLRARRLGCVEMTGSSFGPSDPAEKEAQMLASMKAYFQLLDLASTAGIPMETVALPLLGAGRQRLGVHLVVIPLLNECIACLKRNPSVRQILFVERNPQNAFALAKALDESYALHREMTEMPSPAPAAERMVFISYSSMDMPIMKSLSEKLEAKGLRTWYAPRDINKSDYATAIVKAIRASDYFVVILSKNSMGSEHVLNEIDLAFSELQRGIRFLPLRVDEEELAPAFTYYLSRQHWVDAHKPPLESRLEEFAERVQREE